MIRADAMNRDVCWAPVGDPGLEHCQLIGDGLVVDYPATVRRVWTGEVG